MEAPPGHEVTQNCPLHLTTRSVETVATRETLSIISPKVYQVFQRNGSNVGDIVVSGRYTGVARQIEASWNGSEWRVLSAQPRGGVFSGVLTGMPEGQGQLRVRHTRVPTVSASVSMVGVGDIFVIAGQSNASGRAIANQRYNPGDSACRAGNYKNDNMWGHLVDPYDRATNQVDAVSKDLAAAGSWIPRIAQQFIQTQDIPIGFIPCAMGGTSISQWNRVIASNTLYGSMWKRIKAGAQGKVKAVLWFQGESDSNTAQSVYRDAISQFADDVYSDFQVPVIPALIGDYPSDAGNYRKAQRMGTLEAIAANEHLLMGPAFYDEAYDVDLHYRTDTKITMVGDRFWAAIKQHFYEGTNGWGPELVSAVYNAGDLKTTLTFTGSVLSVNTTDEDYIYIDKGGVRLDAYAPVKVNSTTVTVQLKSAPAAGAKTISWGHDNRSGVDKAILGVGSLPAVPVYQFPIT